MIDSELWIDEAGNDVSAVVMYMRGERGSITVGEIKDGMCLYKISGIKNLKCLAAILPKSEQDKLVEQNVDIPEIQVKMLIKNGRVSSEDYDDMVGVGNVHLVNLVKTYDPKRNPNFRAYAMLMVKRALNAWLERSYDDSKEISLDSPVGEGEDSGVTLKDFIADSLSLEEKVDGEELRKILDEMVGQLKPIEKRIIVLNFGLKDGIFVSLEDLAKELKMTPQSVSVYKERALKRMREVADRHGLGEFKASLARLVKMAEYVNK